MGKAMIESQHISILRRFVVLFFALQVSVLSWAETQDWSYTFRPGDSIWAVCKKFSYYEKCWQELADYNNINKADRISVGTRIKMPLSWLQAPLEAARIVSASGVIKIIRDSKVVELPEVGTVLEIGDRVELGEGALVLAFADGSQLVLEPNSELIIDAVSAIKQTRQSEIQVSLPKGSARVSVKQASPPNIFRVRTSTGIAAVRGTTFRVRNDAADPVTRTEVLEGIVDYSAQSKTVSLDQGFGTLIEQGRPPSDPVELLPAPDWLPQCPIPNLVEWVALTDADAYLLEVLEDRGEASQTLARYSVDKSFYEFTDLEDGCYQLRVLGIENGFYGLDSMRNFCYEAYLAEPVIKLAQLSDDQLYLQLSPVNGASHYVVEFSDSKDFATIATSHEIAQPEAIVQIDESSAYLYARAKAKSGDTLESSVSPTTAVAQEQESNLIWVILSVLAAIAIL